MTDMHSVVAHVVGLALTYGIGWIMGRTSGESDGYRRAIRERMRVIRRAQCDQAAQVQGAR